MSSPNQEALRIAGWLPFENNEWLPQTPQERWKRHYRNARLMARRNREDRERIQAEANRPTSCWMFSGPLDGQVLELSPRIIAWNVASPERRWPTPAEAYDPVASIRTITYLERQQHQIDQPDGSQKVIRIFAPEGFSQSDLEKELSKIDMMVMISLGTRKKPLARMCP